MSIIKSISNTIKEIPPDFYFPVAMAILSVICLIFIFTASIISDSMRNYSTRVEILEGRKYALVQQVISFCGLKDDTSTCVDNMLEKLSSRGY